LEFSHYCSGFLTYEYAGGVVPYAVMGERVYIGVYSSGGDRAKVECRGTE
tara:strand:+ start:144 stop:293 length:150 start_codon:yes stop_codon:yes gene_type:complete